MRIDDTQNLRTLLIACRTLYWIKVRLENRGIPEEVIRLFEQVEEQIITRAEAFESFEATWPKIIIEVDGQHTPERPAPGIDQDQRWAHCQNSLTDLHVINTCLAGLPKISAAMANSGINAEPIKILAKAMTAMIDWLKQAVKHIELGKRIADDLPKQSL